MTARSPEDTDSVSVGSITTSGVPLSTCAFAHFQALDATAHRRRNPHLHLHRLDHDEGIANAHLVTGLNQHRHDDRRRRRSHQPARVRATRWSVVHLDKLAEAVADHDAERPAEAGEATLEPSSSLHVDVLAASFADHPVPLGAEAEHDEAILLTA